MHLTRRHIICKAAAAPLVLAALATLPGCDVVSSNTTNGVTTIEINVTKLSAWTTAINNFTGFFLPLIPGGAAAYLIVKGIGGIIATDVQNLGAQTNGQVSLSFDSTSIPNVITSLEKDAQTLITDATAAVPQIPVNDQAAAQTYLSALETIVSLFQAAVNPSPLAAAASPASVPARKAAETKALTTLGVR